MVRDKLQRAAKGAGEDLKIPRVHFIFAPEVCLLMFLSDAHWLDFQ